MNKYFDHTLLKADATETEIKQLISEAKVHDFMSVCINPAWVSTASKLLQDSPVKVCTVIGFPLGATPSAVKAFEASLAEKDGANEVDMVINIGFLKSGKIDLVKKDIEDVVNAVSKEVVVKVIIEISLLTKEEIVIASTLAKEAGADFVKTSTGFSTGGATIEAVKLMRKTVGTEIGVKASGGIKNALQTKDMIDAGANRIGTSSGIAIMANQKTDDDSSY